MLSVWPFLIFLEHFIYVFRHAVHVETYKHLVYIQTIAESSFMENNKNGTLNGTVVLNRANAIADFVPVSRALQSAIPHDHAMVLTR